MLKGYYNKGDQEIIVDSLVFFCCFLLHQELKGFSFFFFFFWSTQSFLVLWLERESWDSLSLGYPKTSVDVQMGELHLPSFSVSNQYKTFLLKYTK